MAALVVLAALLAPSAAAQDADVRQYLAFVHTTGSTTGEVAESTILLTKPHDWDRSMGQSVLEVRATYIVQAGAATNPEATFRILWDGVPVPSCEWRLQGGTITGGRFNPAVALFCQLPAFAEPGNHTIQVQRTAVTGQPVVESTISIVLHQRETVIMEITVASALDTWLPMLAAGFLFVFGFFYGLKKHPAWGLLVLVAFLGVLTQALKDQLPAGLQMPWEYAIVGAAVVFLLMYVVGGLGFLRKKNGREEHDTT